MVPAEPGVQAGVVLVTSFVTLITGFLLGLYTSRGYLISPELSLERSHNLGDPVESDESDIDESDSLLDHAPNWANGEQADRKQGLRVESSSPTKTAAAATTAQQLKGQVEKQQEEKLALKPGEECKLVLVVRTDLGMTKGKIAAQCSHATLSCFKRLSRSAPETPSGRILSRWEHLGQAKIALQASSQDELLELRRRARDAGLVAEVIQDAGRTQIEAGSITVLGVGPGPKSLVDTVTGHLKLL